MARLRRHGRRLCDGRPEQADAADARHRPAHRQITATSACRRRWCRLLAAQLSFPGCDLNSILFLMTPAGDENKLNTLIAKLVMFRPWDADAPLQEVLPSLYAANTERYAGATIRSVCRGCMSSTAAATSRRCSANASAPSFPELADAAAGRLPRALVGSGVDYLPLDACRAASRRHLHADLSTAGSASSCQRALGRARAQPVSTTSTRSRNRSNRFPGFNCRVQGVFPGEGSTAASCSTTPSCANKEGQAIAAPQRR